MPTYNSKGYSSTKNLNLREGILRFGATNTANPVGSADYGLYVNGSGALIFSAAGVATTLGATGGSGTIPSFEALYNNDSTFAIGGSTFTIDRTGGNGDVLTLTNTGAGSGDVIQITNVGTGKDINGTSSLWSFAKTGAGTALTMTLAGTADSDSLVLTQGDVSIADGKVALTNQDNEGTLVITNNGLTSAAALSMQGSGTFTGSTTTSFFLISPSGLTTGTAMYLVANALTTGKGIHVVANAVTTGQAVLISSSVATTVLTTTGRLFKVDHTGNASGTGTVAEIASAAADETVIFKVTASAALATGVAIQVSGSSVTTGKGITVADFDALTTGMGIHIASSATAITTTGRMFLSDHTGATGTSATLNEFKTAATDETIVVAITTAAMVNGIALSIVGTTGMTSGSLIRATSSTAGAVATNGIYSFVGTGDFTVGAVGLGMFHVANNTSTAGTIASFSGTGLTTGVLMHLASTGTGITSGGLFRATTGTTGAVATNGVVSIRATGAYTSTSNVGLFDVVASAITGDATVARFASTAASQLTTEIVNITQSGATMTGYTGNMVNITAGYSGTGSTGNAMLITTVATTQGNAIKIVANALTLGAATGILVSHTTSVLGAGTSLIRVSSTGVDTGTTTGVLLDLSTTSAAGATQVLLTDSSADTGARIGIYSKVTNAAAVLAKPFQSSNVAVVNSKFTKHYVMTDGTKTCVIWLSQDGTDPNGTLSGTAGDMLLNGPSSKIYFCTGTTNWTATT